MVVNGCAVSGARALTVDEGRGRIEPAHAVPMKSDLINRSRVIFPFPERELLVRDAAMWPRILREESSQPNGMYEVKWTAGRGPARAPIARLINVVVLICPA